MKKKILTRRKVSISSLFHDTIYLESMNVDQMNTIIMEIQMIQSILNHKQVYVSQWNVIHSKGHSQL
jgi:hypothetical protein